MMVEVGSMIIWNVGNRNGTQLLGFFDAADVDFEGAIAKLKAAGAEDDGPGDKTTVEFHGTFNGAVFTLYDYKNDDRLHIGGHRGDPRWFEGEPLDVDGLKAALGGLL
jgi:hypothetical protein